MPIRNADDEVVAVAQVINKIGAPEGFSKDDEKVKQRALSIVTNEAKYVSCKTVPVKMRKNKQKFVSFIGVVGTRTRSNYILPDISVSCVTLFYPAGDITDSGG